MMNPNSPETIFVGDSEMARLMRSHNWSQTLLGIVPNWASSLKTAVSICLNSRFPMVIWWGKDLVLLYNDAWQPILGTKHPKALGRPGQEVWSEIWDIIGVQLHSVLETAQATWSDDMLLPVDRYGYTEEAYFTYSYSPIFLETGEVGGAFTAVTETTRRVIGERRLSTLRELAANTVEVKSVEETCQIASTTLANNPYDISFALLYLVEMDGKVARLVQRVRIEAGTAASPEQVDLTQEQDCWNLAQVKTTGNAKIIDELGSRLGWLSGGVWEEPSRSAIVLPIAQAGQKEQLAGLLVLGISPRREFDDEYRGFFDLVASNVATAIANAYAYEEERKRAESLAELDRAKTIFFSNISHEFRTPLTLMLNPLEDTLANSDGLSPSDRTQLEIVYRNSQRLLKLVNTLLDFSRIEAGRIQAVYEPTDLATLTADLAGVFRSAIERAGMRLQVDCPPLPEPIYVDREMWEKIVLNLLSNAFKFTFEGEISVSLRLRVGEMGSGGDGEPEAISSIAPLLLRPSVVLEVQDTGTGIPAEELPHIFERFHRVKGARGRSYEGSGIGLALVQELVKLHSGTIQVNSVVDQGTCFTIAIPMGFAHLPRECIGATRTLASTATGAMPYVEEMLRWSSKSIDSSDARASELSVSIPVQSQVSSAPTARVLLVDDNADLRDYLKRLLSQQYEVETVADGVSALAAIRQQMPDLVLTDVMMPGMDGFELLQSLRSDSTTQDIPIILLSARAGEEARIEGLEAGADDYLTKPFSARELLARIEANLKLAQLRREATQREQALRLAAEAAQQKVETILSSISDGFYTLDRNWCFTYVNDRVCEIAGMPREALLGFNVWELFPEAVEADAYPQLHRAMGERVAVQFEYFHSPRNCWIENRGYPSPDGVAVFLADITDRKRVEAERRQAEAEIQQLNQQLNHRITELQTLFDLLPVGVAIAEDPECRTIHANPYLSELIRVPIEVNASQSAPPDERPLYRLCRNGEEIPVENLPMQYAASQNTGVKDEIVDIVHPDGTVVKLLSYCSPLLDEQGNVRGVLGAFVDITQRVATETALRESEERLKLAVEAGRMVAWEWNPFDNTIITSSNFSEIYGLSELQAAEQGFALLHPEDRSRHQATVEQAVVTSSSYHSEFRIIRPDTGAIVWLEERGQAILNSAGNLQKLIGVAIDITERKRAEEALRISRDRLAFVLNNTGIGLWLNSLPLNDLNWDNRTREFFFVLPDVEPTFDLFWSRLHPDDREPTRLAVEAALRDRTLYQIDHRAVNPDTGEIRWIRSAGKATYASDGIPIRFDGINYDITDRKQTEQALRQAEERLRVALQNAPITVFNQDHELKYTWIHNPVLHDLQEMLGKHDRDFLPPEDAEPLTTIKQRVLETGIGVREEIKVTRDRTHYYDLTVEPLRDANNTVVGITCAAVDVSELKQAEIDLRKSEERLRLAMEGAQMGTWDLDLITGKAIWSELHFTMLGYEPVSTGEATEAMWHSCIHPDDLERVMQEWQQARQERRIYQTEYRVVRADNQQISWLAGLGSFTYNQNGEAIRSLGVLFDVTDRKQSEQMLIEQKQLLELIATGHSLDECLSAICTSVSKLNPNTRACVLLTDAERLTFPRSITPDFPPSFGQGLKDAPINELCIGTCGEAVHCGEPVTCADIANDDRWSQEWRDLCVAHGILACHSSPIFGLEGLSLGSLMLCFNEARIPTDWEYQLANFGTQVASIAFERDRSSLALRESEARFRNMADNAPFMVWVTDPTGCCTYLSQSWYDFSGQTPEIGLGYGWLNAVHPDDQESARATFLAANDRHESFRLEYRLRRKDGEYSWAIDAATPWFGEDGQCKGYVGSVIDISDRKQIEVALQQNEDRLRLAIEAAQLGTWDWNLSTNELLLDEVGKTLFGLLPEAEASFEDCFERLHPDDRERLKQVVQSSLNPASGGTYDAEYRTVSLQGGVERWIKAKGQVYFDPAGHPRRFIGTLLDITEQKRAETEREQLLAREQAAREAAEAANRIKDEFLAVVSHELRSPLNPILGWSKLLRSRQLDEQKTDRALEVIERNAQMQAQLINDLLDVSRILRGKLSLDTKPVDLVTTIQAAMETVRLAAAAKSIQINTQFEPDVGQVAGDAGRLQQVIWNLLTNAVKFTSEGGRVDIRLERIDSQAQITITDTGKGIPPDFLPYVFEQFRQESSATTRRFGGLGLGLAIVRYLVELHGGTVQADSQGEGMGATFTVKFPLMPHQPITKPDPKPSELSLNLQGTRILVVDDDDNTREFLAFLLELHGANVIATATAGEALTTLTQFKPDVLLSDIGMPDVDGYMLMRQVRALPPEQGGTIPAIALTAYAGEIDYQQAMAAGFQRHIAKPIEPEILIQAIATLLEQT